MGHCSGQARLGLSAVSLLSQGDACPNRTREERGRLGAISKPRNPALQLGLNPPEVTKGL